MQRKPHKLLIYGHSNNDETMSTGVAQYNLDLLGMLENEGSVEEITFVHDHKSCNRFQELELSSKVELVPIELLSGKIHRLFKALIFLSTIFGLTFLIPMLARIIAPNNHAATLMNKYPDYTHFLYTSWGANSEFPVLLRASSKNNIISAIHDTRCLHYKASWSERFWGIIKLKAILASSDSVLAPSKQVVADLRTLNQEVKIIETSAIPKIDVPLSWKASQYKGLSYIFYPNTFVETKNHMVFVDVLKRLKGEFCLVLSGSGSENETAKDFFNACLEENVGHLVHHEGFVDENRKFDLMRGSAALVMPTIGFESYSLSIWEAFGIGCPVIASKESDLQEQVKGFGRMCDPYDAGDIVSQLKEVQSRNYSGSLLQRQAHDYYLERQKIAKKVVINNL